MAERQEETTAAQEEVAVDYENIELNFDDDDDEEGDFLTGMPSTYEAAASIDDEMSSSLYPSCASAPSLDDLAQPVAEDSCCKKQQQIQQPEYILGTLIVRVVAARELESVHSTPGLFFFGGGGDVSQKKKGSSNPYASVQFGNTVQRTSPVFDTVNPTWPRGEAMYMDVTQVVPEQETEASASASGDSSETTEKVKSPPKSSVVSLPPPPPTPMLTVAVFHSHKLGKLDDNHNNNNNNNNSSNNNGHGDDPFLGLASVDLTPLITGKISTWDEWVPLGGSQSNRASIRVVCEYEASDALPQPGDWVRFTQYCHPTDLYPLNSRSLYQVSDTDGDNVLIQWTSPEGWVSTVCAHRHMLLCQDRHVTVLDRCHDEWSTWTKKVAHAPLVHTVQKSVERVPDEGLVGVGAHAWQEGRSIAKRWMESGWKTALEDVVVATNWDGRFNPEVGLHEEEEEEADDDKDAPERSRQDAASIVSNIEEEALPNMPACPITGEPMRDPVVAADGHTYERSAIARWLQTSVKSPLTGSVLPHKNLVPNYMLLSSLQEAAGSSLDNNNEESPGSVGEQSDTLLPPADITGSDEDVTTEIDINS